MNNPQVSNPNDHKVVDFTNRENFGFTPEMGCMFNGNPIFGITGAPGINAGESMKLPYHVAHRLATNLAKVAMTRQAPRIDPSGIPTGVPLWDTTKLEELKNSYITELYTQEKPVAQTETERLMQMVKDLNKVVEGLVAKDNTEPAPVPVTPVSEAPKSEVVVPPVAEVAPTAPAGSAPSAPETKTPDDKPSALKQAYQDKQEVIAKLEALGIKHDKRKGKEDLEKLLPVENSSPNA